MTEFQLKIEKFECGCALCTWRRMVVPEGESLYAKGWGLNPEVFATWDVERWEIELKRILALNTARLRPGHAEIPLPLPAEISSRLDLYHKHGLSELIHWTLLDVDSTPDEVEIEHLLKVTLEALATLSEEVKHGNPTRSL